MYSEYKLLSCFLGVAGGCNIISPSSSRSVSVQKCPLAVWVCVTDCCSDSGAAVSQPETIRWTVTGRQSQHQFIEDLEELIVPAFVFTQ